MPTNQELILFIRHARHIVSLVKNGKAQVILTQNDSEMLYRIERILVQFDNLTTAQ